MVDGHVHQQGLLHLEAVSRENRGAEEPHVRRLDTPDCSRGDEVPDSPGAPREAEVLTNHQPSPRGFGRRDDRLGLGHGRRERLLHEAVQAGGERLGCDRLVGRRRDGDERPVGVDGCKRVRERGETPLGRHQRALADPGERFGVEIHERRELPVGRLLDHGNPARAPRTRSHLDDPKLSHSA